MCSSSLFLLLHLGLKILLPPPRLGFLPRPRSGLVRNFPSIHVYDFFSFLAQEAALYIWNLAPSSFGISHSSSFRNFHHPYLGCFHHPTPRVLILPLPNFLSNRDFRNPLLPSTFHRLMRPFSELTPPSPSSPSFHAAVTMNLFSAFCSSIIAAAEYFRTRTLPVQLGTIRRRCTCDQEILGTCTCSLRLLNVHNLRSSTSEENKGRLHEFEYATHQTRRMFGLNDNVVPSKRNST